MPASPFRLTRMYQNLAFDALQSSVTVSGNSCTSAKKLPVRRELNLNSIRFCWQSRDYREAVAPPSLRFHSSFVFDTTARSNWLTVSWNEARCVAGTVMRINERCWFN
jgi:hypothetical protein